MPEKYVFNPAWVENSCYKVWLTSVKDKNRAYYNLCYKEFDIGESVLKSHMKDGYEKLLAQLDYLKFSSQRSAEAQRANSRQIEELDKILTDMEKEVVKVKEVVAERHVELEEAKKSRMNKMRYDALGRIISSLPDRKSSMKQLERIEEDIKTLKLQKEALQKKSDEREKHLHLLLTTTHELKYKFRKELEDFEGSESD